MNSFSKFFGSRKFTGVAGLALISVAILVSGCSSMNRPASASFAGVIISNQSVEKIKTAAITVFTQNGYTLMSLPGDELAFEREATRREQLEYAGVVGSHQGEQVLMRVRLGIEPNNANSFWLSAKAYAVCNPGQAVFESSTALFNFQSGPYQKLLDKVKGAAEQPGLTP